MTTNCSFNEGGKLVSTCEFLGAYNLTTTYRFLCVRKLLRENARRLFFPIGVPWGWAVLSTVETRREPCRSDLKGLLFSSVRNFPLTFHSQVQNTDSPNYSRRNFMRDVERINTSTRCHLSKLSKAKFSILYDVSLVKNWRRKLKLITPGIILPAMSTSCHQSYRGGVGDFHIMHTSKEVCYQNLGENKSSTVTKHTFIHSLHSLTYPLTHQRIVLLFIHSDMIIRPTTYYKLTHTLAHIQLLVFHQRTHSLSL